MKNTTTPEDLGKQIEQLVAKLIAGARTEVSSAVERSFAAAETESRGTVPRAREHAARRSAEVMTEVEGRLHALVCAHPGESMALFARELAMEAAALAQAEGRGHGG